MAFPHGLSVKEAQLLRWHLKTHKNRKKKMLPGGFVLRFRPRTTSGCLKHLCTSTVSRGEKTNFASLREKRKKKMFLTFLIHHREEVIHGRTKSICLFSKEEQSTLCLRVGVQEVRKRVA